MRDLSLLWRRVVAAGLFALALLALAAPAAAADPPVPLDQRVTPEIRARLFPAADRFGPAEGTPGSIAAYQGETLLGYLYSTLDVVRAPGYAGVPFDAIGGVDLQSKITGAVLIYHREPHILDNVQRAQKLDTLLDRQTGQSIRGAIPPPGPEFVAGATVSARAVRAAVYDSARIVMRARGHVKEVTEPTLDVDGFRVLTFDELIAEGALSRIVVTNADLAARFAAAGMPDAVPEITAKGAPDDVYIMMTVTLATPLTMGRNMLSPSSYDNHIANAPPGTYKLLLASDGRYDFLGNNYHRSANGFRMDRFRVVQGDHVWEMVKDDFERVGLARLGTVSLRYSGLFALTAEEGFDPLKPFRLDLFVHAKRADGSDADLTIPIDYQVPASLILLPTPPPTPAWMEAWQAARSDVIILVSALLVLTLILVFQQQLTKYRRIYRPLRNLFLLFTLVWLGWTVGGQLSTLHFVNYLQAPFHTFDIGFYLAEPIIVVLAVYALIGVVLIGRGVFCGWLCPFGALQELLAQVARLLRLPQWNPSEKLQRKLWMGKYIAAAVVISLAFIAPEAGSIAAEVEPFKTAITSPFERTWPFIIYAVGLLGLGLFSERAYCRFLCPLGGMLAVLDRLHIIDLLKRRPECGTPCQLCSHSCPVKAIEKSGRIKMAECFQCLDCQVEYNDDHRCPPLVKGRKQAARATAKVIIRPVPAIARAVADPAE